MFYLVAKISKNKEKLNRMNGSKRNIIKDIIKLIILLKNKLIIGKKLRKQLTKI